MSATNGHVLGDVASFVRGITFTPEDLKPPFEKGTAVCMRTKNVQVDLDEQDLIAVPKEFVRRKEQYLSEGDLLVSSANSWNLVGKCCWVPKLDYEATAGGFISILRADRKKVYPRYLYHWFAASQTQHEVRLCGRQTTNISNLNYERCLNLPIPLPMLEEQKRIAEILDKADAIRRQRRETLSQVSALIDSRFLEVFGDPVGNPRKWRPGTFDDQVTLLQYGPRFFNEAYVEVDGIRIVRITDLDFQGRLDYSAMPLMDVSDEDRQKFVLKPGDLLLARSGATVGKTALIDDRAPECIAGAYFIRMRFKDDVRPLYVQMVLRSKLVQQMIASRSQQSAQQNFNGPAIRALPLPVPPIELQDEFVQFHAAAIALGERMAKQSGESDALFNSLVQRAFKGEL
jgi:type I restriction enzyme S subunit